MKIAKSHSHDVDDKDALCWAAHIQKAPCRVKFDGVMRTSAHLMSEDS
jgi:hypothetical protein